MPMHADSIEKTAFTTPDGQCEFLRMAFGLECSIGISESKTKVLKDLALVYMDDMLITYENIKDGQNINIMQGKTKGRKY